MEINYTNKEKEALEKNYQEALKNDSLKKLINHIGLTEQEAKTKITKLEDTLRELENCRTCNNLYTCKNAYQGHVSMPKKEDGRVYFTYIPCKYKKKEAEARKNHLSEREALKQSRMKDIDVSDKKRIEVIKWLDKFYTDYDFSKNLKGLYLHGNFGCGKTFLISALLHELNIKKGVQVEIIYFPEILRDLKSDWETYDLKMQKYMNIDILCIDDIGAEKVSEWGRDEVLGTILQSRMNNNLTTFFTSNLNLQELENHFLITTNNEEYIKSRRIMERIKQLSIDMELLSENRRN